MGKIIAFHSNWPSLRQTNSDKSWHPQCHRVPANIHPELFLAEYSLKPCETRGPSLRSQRLCEPYRGWAWLGPTEMDAFNHIWRSSHPRRHLRSTLTWSSPLTQISSSTPSLVNVVCCLMMFTSLAVYYSLASSSCPLSAFLMHSHLFSKLWSCMELEGHQQTSQSPAGSYMAQELT